jgi:uncharacterized caspase-like protein
LAIGVSRYANSNLNLEYADNDAKAVSDTLKMQEGKIYAKVNIKTLVNESATRGNILQSITSYLAKAGPKDMVLIFIAGHGVKNIQTGSYYFLPHNADNENYLYEGVNWSDFDEIVKILSGNVNKVIIIVDTCHSGSMKVSMRGVQAGEELGHRISESSGIYILSGSKAGELSIESNRYKMSDEKKGHGAFTYSILRGLSGQANYDNDSYLTIGELFSFVAKEVPKITNGQQHPYSKIEGTDLPIAIVK